MQDSPPPIEDRVAVDAFKQSLANALGDVALPRSTAPGLLTCVDCGERFPLRAVNPSEASGRWVCATCGRFVDAVLDREADPSLRENVIMAPLSFSLRQRHRDRPIVPDAVHHDARRHRREPVDLPVRVMPLDDNLVPCGEAYEGTAHDISTGGLGMVHHQAIETRYLALEFAAPSGDKIQVVLEVVHTRPVGDCFASGGRFVRRIGQQRSTKGVGNKHPSGQHTVREDNSRADAD